MNNWLTFRIVMLFMTWTIPLSPGHATETSADIYKTYCWQCHGMAGNGMGLNIPDMSIQPRDHTNAEDMSTRSDELLFDAIKGGGQAITKSVLMPPWGDVLSDEQIHGLVDYLRTLCNCQFGEISKP